MDVKDQLGEPMAEIKLLRIEWEGPFSLDAVLAMTTENDYGLYQIYAHHLVFGSGSLIYIGKAQERSFGVRFVEHRDYWLKWESDITIRVGHLAVPDYRTDDDWAEWRQLVSDAERLTISWHTPPYNSQFITGYQGSPLWIQNWGNRGSLLPEYSSHWRPLRPDDACAE